MDVGGGTTDLSVWLGGAPRAAIEASLLLGCRQILFDSLSARPAAPSSRRISRARRRGFPSWCGR